MWSDARRRVTSKYEYIFFLFFFYLVSEAIGTAATPGLLCQPQGDSEDDCGEADGM
jgi:hypothetical protein